MAPLLITRLFKPIGQGFLIYDAQNNENLFDDLWTNQAIGIMSTAKHESMIRDNNIPDIIIDPYNQDWKEEINSRVF